MNTAQAAKDPRPVGTSYAFRSLDGSENKRTLLQNEQISRYQLTGLYNSTGTDEMMACPPGPFGLKARPIGHFNFALEDALDGRRRRSLDFLPEQMQDKIRKEDDAYLASLSDQSITTNQSQCGALYDYLTPRNSHVEKNSRGELVTDIQVTRNRGLQLPQAPAAYIMANRPYYGVSSRENVKELLGQTQSTLKGMENIQRYSQQIAQNGLTWS